MNQNHKAEQKSQDDRATTKEGIVKDSSRSANHNAAAIKNSGGPDVDLEHRRGNDSKLSQTHSQEENESQDLDDYEAAHDATTGDDQDSDEIDYEIQNSKDAEFLGEESSYLDNESLKLAEYLPLELRRIITYYLPRYSQRLSENLRSILSDKWFITLIDLDVNGHLKIGFSWNQEELCISLTEVSAGAITDGEFPNLLTSSANLIRVLKGQLNPQIALLNGQISYQGNNQVLYILNVFSAINCRHIIRTIERE